MLDLDNPVKALCEEVIDLGTDSIPTTAFILWKIVDCFLKANI